MMATSGHWHLIRYERGSPLVPATTSIKKKGSISLWDLTEGQRVATLRGHAGAVFDVEYSPDGKTLASASYDKSIRLWDPLTGAERAALHRHDRWVRAIEFLPDGSALLSASGDGTIIRWDTQDRLIQRD